MAYGQAQRQIKSGYKPKYDPVSSQADDYVTAMQSDGGKSALNAFTDGAKLGLSESFERFGLNTLARKYEAERQAGNDVPMVSAKEAEEKWGLKIDKPMPLHEVTFLKQLNDEAIQNLENVLQDLSLRHGPVNFLGAVAGTLGAAALLPSNYLGLALYKHVKNLPRYYRLIALAKRARAARNVKNLKKMREINAAKKALKVAAAKQVPILESAAVVGAENVLYAHLKESEGHEANKPLAFGIGAGVGLFLPLVGRALTSPFKTRKTIPPTAPKQQVPMRTLEPSREVKGPFDQGPLDKEAVDRFNKAIKEEESQKVIPTKTPDVEKVPIKKAAPAPEGAAKPVTKSPKEQVEEAAAKSINKMQARWRKIDAVEDKIDTEIQPLSVLDDTQPTVKEPVKAREELTPQQKDTLDAVKVDDDELTLEDYISMYKEDTPTPRPSEDERVLMQSVRAVADGENKVDAIVNRLDEITSVPKRAEPKLVKGTLLKSQVPGHIKWGNTLFGDIWEETLINAMAAFRKMGIYANVIDLYPQFAHPKAFKGWVEQQARFLKRTKGVYTTRQLMDKVLEKRPEQIDYYLEKYAKPISKDLGDNKTQDGIQAKAPKVEINNEAAVKTLQGQEDAIIPVDPDVQLRELLVQDQLTKPAMTKEEIDAVLAKPDGPTPTKDVFENVPENIRKIQKLTPDTDDTHTVMYRPVIVDRVLMEVSNLIERGSSDGVLGGLVLSRLKFLKQKSLYAIIDKKTAQHVDEIARILQHPDMPPGMSMHLGHALRDGESVKDFVRRYVRKYIPDIAPKVKEKPKPTPKLKPGESAQVQVLVDSKPIGARRTKEVTMVDKEAVRPTVDNNATAKIALEDRYPDIQFTPSKSAMVEGPQGATATVGKNDIFNLKYKGKEGQDIELMQLGPEQYAVRVAAPEAAGKKGVLLAKQDYKTLHGALKAFKKHVGNKAKVPEIDEIKMGPERGAAAVQRTVDDVVKQIKSWVDCKNGKSVQSSVQQTGDASAVQAGGGATGVN